MVSLIAQAVPFADTWSMHGGDVGFGWWLVMTIGMVLFWGGVVALLVFLLRGDGRGSRSQDAAPAGPTPREVLDRRLAEGSIDVEEYERRRRLLQGFETSAESDDAALGTGR